MKAAITIASCCLMICLGAPAHASLLIVTSLADSGSGSLRDTIASSAVGDEIQFSVSGTIVLTGSIFINKDLSIIGPGADTLTVSGNLVDRVFSIAANQVLIAGMTIRDGFVQGPTGTDGSPNQDGGMGGEGMGGAILIAGTLTLSNCWITANTVRGGTGGRGGDNPIGVAAAPGTGGKGGTGNGGAIYLFIGSQLSAINCTFSTNRAIGGTGGLGGNNNNPVSVVVGGMGGDGGMGTNGVVQPSNAAPAFTNCTFSGNLAMGGDGNTGGSSGTAAGGQGGDGEVGTAGVIGLVKGAFFSCTIVSNSAAGGSGGSGGAGSPNGANGSASVGFYGSLDDYSPFCAVYLGNTMIIDNSDSFGLDYSIDQSDQGYNLLANSSGLGCPIATTTRIASLA